MKAESKIRGGMKIIIKMCASRDSNIANAGEKCIGEKKTPAPANAVKSVKGHPVQFVMCFKI